VILPLTYTEALVCLALSMLLWGSWANLQRLSGKWRYELFYWDFSFGVLLAALLAAFTLGSLNSQELTFSDNLDVASYHKIAYGLAAGLVLNLANLLLVAALSVAPLSVVFPVATGVGLVIGVAWTLFPAQGSLLLPLGGIVVVLTALVVNAFTYSTYAQEQRGPVKPLTPDPRSSTAKPPLPAKGVALSVMSGIALGMASPLLTICRAGEDGLGAYAAAFLIGIATIVSTLVYSPFFTVFAVHGAPVQLRTYFKGSRAQHLYGLLAGGLWSGGLIASFASGGALAAVQAGPVVASAFSGGAAIVATLWGWLAWREFKGSNYRVRLLLTAMLILWTVGAAMIAIGPDVAK
jgi:glucose uptake protein